MPPRIKKVAVYLAVFMGGATVGLIGGIYAEDAVYRARAMVYEIGTIEHDGALMELAMSLKDDAAKEAALKAHLERIGRADPRDPQLTALQVPRERVLTLARLSYVAGKMGHMEQSQDYLTQAIQACATIKAAGCGRDELAEIGRRLTDRDSK